MDAPLLATVDVPRPGVAEDAPPLALVYGGTTLLGVFDGLGGAGVRAVDGEDGRRSCAYYASRIARAATAEVFARGGEDFGAAIGIRLAERQCAVPVIAGPLRSTLLRSYPTTAAIMLVAADSVTALWAGDSRCYVLTPASGLQQLSRDDGAGSGGPLTHLLYAGGPGSLHRLVRQVDGPAILLVATDGAYGSLPSPIFFEFALLDALATSRDPAEWSAALAVRLAPLADDDISLAAAFVTWSPDLFAPRRRALARLLEAPMDAAWDRYRPGYLALAGVE